MTATRASRHTLWHPQTILNCVGNTATKPLATRSDPLFQLLPQPKPDKTLQPSQQLPLRHLQSAAQPRPSRNTTNSADTGPSASHTKDTKYLTVPQMPQPAPPSVSVDDLRASRPSAPGGGGEQRHWPLVDALGSTLDTGKFGPNAALVCMRPQTMLGRASENVALTEERLQLLRATCTRMMHSINIRVPVTHSTLFALSEMEHELHSSRRLVELQQRPQNGIDIHWQPHQVESAELEGVPTSMNCIYFKIEYLYGKDDEEGWVTLGPL